MLLDHHVIVSMIMNCAIEIKRIDDRGGCALGLKLYEYESSRKPVKALNNGILEGTLAETWDTSRPIGMCRLSASCQVRQRYEGL